MTTNPRDIEEMARLKKILDGAFSSPQGSSVPRSISDSYAQPQPITESLDSSSDATQDMKKILSAFYRGGNTVQRLSESSTNVERFKEALNTEKTASGVQVGSWEITIKEHESNKTYDIVNIHTSEPIAQDLTLYETALAITTCLNRRMSISSPKIREILDLEDKYATARYEAAVFKRKARRLMESDNVQNASIAEDRYAESKSTAIYYRTKIRNISASL